MLTPHGEHSLRHAFSVPSQHATGMLTPQGGRQLKAPFLEGGAMKGREEQALISFANIVFFTSLFLLIT